MRREKRPGREQKRMIRNKIKKIGETKKREGKKIRRDQKNWK